MQMASLFTSLEEVDAQACRKDETVQDYSRRKALTKLTKARFMKRMEKITKDLKEKNPITHNYSMPKPTNDTVLTKTLPQISDQLTVIPNIKNDIQDELNKLGISTNFISNQLLSNEISHVTSSPYHRMSSSSRTIQQPQKTIEITEEMKMNKTIQEQKNANIFLSIPEQKQKIMTDFREDKEKSDIQSMPTSMPSQLHTENQHKTTDSIENKENPNNEHVQTSLPSQLNTQHQQKTRTAYSTDQHQEKPNEVVKHIYGENPQRRRVCESESESMDNTEDTQRRKSGTVKFKKLKRNQYKTAYPWAHEASQNTFKKTPLAKEVEYISSNSMEKRLTLRMKEKLCKVIELPPEVMEEINSNIEYTKLQGLKCKICSRYFQQNCRYYINRHIKAELGYHHYQCTFCNYTSMKNSCVFNHYASQHGIPKKWVSSVQLSDNSSTDNSDNDDFDNY